MRWSDYVLTESGDQTMCSQTAEGTIFNELQHFCISQMALYRGYDVYRRFSKNLWKKFSLYFYKGREVKSLQFV